MADLLLLIPAESKAGMPHRIRCPVRLDGEHISLLHLNFLRSLLHLSSTRGTTGLYRVTSTDQNVVRGPDTSPPQPVIPPLIQACEVGHMREVSHITLVIIATATEGKMNKDPICPPARGPIAVATEWKVNMDPIDLTRGLVVTIHTM